MRRLLCTIGFTGKTAEEFFALLSYAGVEQVIDVRQNRGGQLSAFAKYPDLEYFLKNIVNVGYQDEPLLAPTPELRKTYQADKNWSTYEAAFLRLLKQRNVPQALDASTWPANVALLCTEPGPEKCHRRLVADLLAEHWRATGDEVEVRHLATNSKAKARTVPAPQDPPSASNLSHVKKIADEITATSAITGSAATLGSRSVASQEVDRAFGMPAGKLRTRAGIESLSYAAEDENEITLGAAAMLQALAIARCDAKEVDWIIATSETHQRISFAGSAIT